MRHSPKATWLVPLLLLSVAGCGSPPEPTQAGMTDVPPATEPKPLPPSAGPPGQAHALVLRTAGCWFGGLWSDALGIEPDRRRSEAEKRCMDLVKRMYGTENVARYDQLRL